MQHVRALLRGCIVAAAASLLHSRGAKRHATRSGELDLGHTAVHTQHGLRNP
jgi:hypothetical protein